MKASRVVISRDEASGTTILEDGTKAHWHENKPVIVIAPDGARSTVSGHEPKNQEWLNALDEATWGSDSPEKRPMSLSEEKEYLRACLWAPRRKRV